MRRLIAEQTSIELERIKAENNRMNEKKENEKINFLQ